jgi:hypothetical protein
MKVFTLLQAIICIALLGLTVFRFIIEQKQPDNFTVLIILVLMQSVHYQTRND